MMSERYFRRSFDRFPFSFLPRFAGSAETLRIDRIGRLPSFTEFFSWVLWFSSSGYGVPPNRIGLLPSFTEFLFSSGNSKRPAYLPSFTEFYRVLFLVFLNEFCLFLALAADRFRSDGQFQFRRRALSISEFS